MGESPVQAQCVQQQQGILSSGHTDCNPVTRFDQMKILIRLGCDVVFAFDKDVDIRKDHNIAKLRNYVNVFYLRDRDKLLSEKDSPVDRGEAVFRKLYEGRLRYR